MKNELHMLMPPTQRRQMNAFVITTEDGRLLVIDGGYQADAEYLLSYLKSLTGSSCPRIDAWILTHPHKDHMAAFLEIMRHHREEVDVGRVFFKFPSVQFFAHAEKETDADAEHMLIEFYELLPYFADRITIVTAGDVYNVGAARLDILFTSDDTLVTNISNNASTVFRLTLGTKTVLFTGDAGVEAGHKILERYADTDLLRCDICQMAHHGQNGCDRAFYEAVRPEICLWCAPGWLWDNDKGGGFDTHIWKTVEVRRWMEDLGVKKNYVAKDGTQILSL